MRKLLLALLVATSIVTQVKAEPKREDYIDLVNELNIVQIYNTVDLMNGDILEHRNGKLIIEQRVGIVTNKETGDGKILGLEENDYICYSRVKGIRDGSIVLTYFIYNPDTNYIDDIMYRCDYIIDRSHED